jgi:hypothetical protein
VALPLFGVVFGRFQAIFGGFFTVRSKKIGAEKTP